MASLKFHLFIVNFFSQSYKSDKAVRRLMQIPVVVFRKETAPGCSILYVIEHKPSVDYKSLLRWITQLSVPEKSLSGLDKQSLSALCKLASTDKDRSIIKYAVCQAQSLSAKEAQNTYGISSFNKLANKVHTALEEAAEIRLSIQDLAEIEDKALLMSLRIHDNLEEEEEEYEGDPVLHDIEDIDSIFKESEVDQDIEVSEGSNNCMMLHEQGTELLDSNNVDNSLGETPLLGQRHLYNPDSLDKTRYLANPAPSHEVLIGWLRMNDLNWFSFYEELSIYLRSYTSEVLHQILLDFTDFLPSSDLSEEEEKQVEVSRQAFLETQRRLHLNTSDIESDSDNDQDPDWNEVQVSELGKETIEKIQAERVRIKRRAERKAAKEIAENSILKRKVPPSVSRLVR